MRSFRLSKLVSASLVAASMLVGASTASFAGAWPARTIKFIVPFPAGGATDTIARVYADKLSEALKQPVVVDNKPGAGTGIAAEYVATSRTRRLHHRAGTGGSARDPAAHQQQHPFRSVQELRTVSLLASVPYVIAGKPEHADHEREGADCRCEEGSRQADLFVMRPRHDVPPERRDVQKPDRH